MKLRQLLRELYKATEPPVVRPKLFIWGDYPRTIRIFIDCDTRVGRRSSDDREAYLAFVERIQDELSIDGNENVDVYPHYIAVDRALSQAPFEDNDAIELLDLTLERIGLDRSAVEWEYVTWFPDEKAGKPRRWFVGRYLCECHERLPH